MVEIGSVIQAKVMRIEPYGVYLKHGDETVVVLAPEVSWRDKRDIREQVHVGDNLNVLVLRFNYQTKEIVGSLRRLRKDDNPYWHLSRLEPGSPLHGKVVGVYSDGVTVNLQNGARGNIPKHRVQQKNLKPGQDIQVTVCSLNVDEGILTLDLTLQEDKQAVPAMAQS